MPLSIASQPIPVAAAPNIAAAAPNPLPIPQVPQRAEEWCWAACIQMVLNAHGVNKQQCDVVNQQYGQVICCGTPEDPACNRPLDISAIASAYGSWRLAARLLSYAVQFNYLASEVGAGRPVQVGFAWTGGGFHVALVCGFGMANGLPFLRVNDPLYGAGSVYYVDLQTAYRRGLWQWTWDSIG